MIDYSFYKKATKFSEIDNAVRLEIPIGPDHEFFIDFSDVRGDFAEKSLYKTLHVNHLTKEFDPDFNQANKTLLFLAGMRGSGKTSELAKIASNMCKPEGYFPVVCNLDDGLDLNNMEYMDILIFQLECLFKKLGDCELELEETIVSNMHEWFSDRIKEVNKAIKADNGFELSIDAGTPSIWSFFKIAGKLKASLTSGTENATKVRTVFKNNFTDFALQFNTFIEQVNILLRQVRVAREILFIVDGLEKTGSLEIRKKIIFEETNRIRQIKVNTIFTLPIELMAQQQILRTFSEVISFPCVKIREKDGSIVEKAVERFVEFTYKRIDERLFDSTDTVRRAILLGGGSPREYLRLLHYAYLYGDDEKGIIDAATLDKAIMKLASETAKYITKPQLDTLKILKDANDNSTPVPFGLDWQELLEKLIVLEYNDGSYKRVNPILEESELYKYYVVGGK